MDYKDLVVIGAAVLGSIGGAALGGPIGWLAGMVVGAGVAATWAHHTDVREWQWRQAARSSAEDADDP